MQSYLQNKKLSVANAPISWPVATGLDERIESGNFRQQ